MLQPADILFAFSDTGGGHRSAAVAISAALGEVSDSASFEMQDLLLATGFPGLRNAPHVYDKLSTRWLRFYDISFQLTNEVHLVDALSRFVYLRARRNIARILQTVRPRVVCVTHPLVHRFICAARRSYRLRCRVVTVVTDLVTLHASWTYPGVDYCTVPTQEAYDLMLRRGMARERMVRTGFPVHPKFAHFRHSQAEARRALAIEEGRFTVLVTSGGVGSGNLRDMVLEMERRCPGKQILVVTGRNRAVYDELRALRRSPLVHIYGFVQNMDELMAASDVVVTKAGPGTLMEAMVMRRPVIVTEAVGMQERGNIDFVLNHDLGRFCPTTERIVDAINELTDPALRAAIGAHLQGSVLRDGATQIAQVLMDQMHLAEQTVSQPARRRLPLPRLRGARRRTR